MAKSAAYSYGPDMNMTRIPGESAPSSEAAGIPPLPGWIAAGSTHAVDDTAHSCGAALAHLCLGLRDGSVPQPLWRARLALMAAERCIARAGRREGAAALRDALHLTRLGDHPGPAGEILGQWSAVVTRPLRLRDLASRLPDIAADRICDLLDRPVGTPIARAARILEAVLADAPRAQTDAVIMADAVLSQSLGWDRLTPLLSLALNTRDLRLSGAELDLACQKGALVGVGHAVPLASDLARRAARLRSIAPKLRAKGADRAIEMFLSCDVLAPAALTGFMSDRAARRLCDRLAALGGLQEVTGREAFRLYGV